MTSAWTDFEKIPNAPAAIASFSIVPSSIPVMTNTLARASAAVIVLQISSPVTCGRFTSTSTTAGRCRRQASTTAAPSPTTARTSTSSDSLRFSACATPGWSSASRTRGRADGSLLNGRPGDAGGVDAQEERDQAVGVSALDEECGGAGLLDRMDLHRPRLHREAD